MINSNMTVREVAATLPHSRRTFEKLKIDYCCGGNALLVDACASAGVRLDQLVEMLERDSETANPEDLDAQSLSLPDLITHILYKHHVFTKNELARIDALMKKVVGVHGENHPELNTLSEDFIHLAADLHPHMFKEEQVLFPYILELAHARAEKRMPAFPPFGTVNNPVRMMMWEHENAGEILKKMRNLTSEYSTPRDACISYKTLYEALEALEKDLHQHIHLENNILFPRASELEAELSARP